MQPDECLICVTKSTTKKVLQPCNHEVCFSCATKLSGSTCPFCRGIVTNWPSKVEEDVHDSETLYLGSEYLEIADENYRHEESDDNNDFSWTVQIAISFIGTVIIVAYVCAMIYTFKP